MRKKRDSDRKEIDSLKEDKMLFVSMTGGTFSSESNDKSFDDQF